MKLRTAGRRRQVRTRAFFRLSLFLGISALSGCIAIGGSELQFVVDREPGPDPSASPLPPGQSGLPSLSREFAASDTLAVPPGYLSAVVDVIGGGGGGGGAGNAAPFPDGGAGGNGGKAAGVYAVTGGDLLEIEVGIGGGGGTNAGCNALPGSEGGISKVLNPGFWGVQASGGQGGAGISGCSAGTGGFPGVGAGGTSFNGAIGVSGVFGSGGVGGPTGVGAPGRGADGNPGRVRILLSPAAVGVSGASGP